MKMTLRQVRGWLFGASRKVKPMTIHGAMLSETGRVREANEDSVAYVLPWPGKTDADIAAGGLALLADGMGGHAAGEVASRLAAEVVIETYYRERTSAPLALATAFDAANRAIRDHADRHPECAGMGTTCTVLAFRDGACFLAHVGDSRAYLYRDGELRQISEEQSLVGAMLREGLLTPEQAARHPDRNIVLQVLGTKPDIAPQIWNEGMALKAGDRLLLCSDGLTDMVDEAFISAVLARMPPHDACLALVDAANEAGGIDNISVGVFTPDAETESAGAIRDTVRLTVQASDGEPS